MKTAIYIITLNSSADMPQQLISSIKKQGLEAKFFTAVDGRKKMPKLRDNESVNMAKSFKYRLTELGTAEIGAYLSHIRCMEAAYEADYDRICIFEDDVSIEETFSETLKEIYSLSEKHEFVRLMDLKRCKRKILNKIGEQRYLTRPEKGTLGAQGYVVNRRGMKKILNKAMPIWKPIDKLYDHYWELDLNLFSIEPHIIWEQTSNTSIKKASYNTSVSLSSTLLWKVNKLLRSISRKYYLAKNFTDFHPKTKSKIKMGKTLRKG